MTRVLCFIFFISNGCVTYDSSFNTGNVLKPGLSNHGLSLHYLVSHEEDVTQKRLKGDESTQRFKSSENIGIGYHFRYGIYKDFEFGTQVSFDFSSVDGTYNLINHEKLAISLQSKLLFPTFSFDEPKSYELGLFFPSSYRLKKTVLAYIAPGLHQKSHFLKNEIIEAVHTGFVFGSQEALFLE